MVCLATKSLTLEDLRNGRMAEYQLRWLWMDMASDSSVARMGTDTRWYCRFSHPHFSVAQNALVGEKSCIHSARLWGRA